MGWIRDNQRLLTTVAAIATAAGTLLIAFTPFFQRDSVPSPSSKPPSEAVNSDTLPNSGSAQVGVTAPFSVSSTSTVSAADIKLVELLSRRRFADILKTADTIFPDVGFRTRSLVYRLQGDLARAEQELDLEELQKRGYPGNIQDGYYRNWPILRLRGNRLIIDNGASDVLAQFDLNAFLPRPPGKVWTLDELKIIRALISPYEADHPYCCILKFLIDGYAPYDVENLAELDLLNGRFELANQRLNLLRLIDWEASFTEVELLSFTASLLQNDYRSAKAFLYGEVQGFDAVRYGEHSRLFLELALSINDSSFAEKLEALKLKMENYQVEYPFSLYDRWFDQPVLEKWLAQLPDTERSHALRAVWLSLKARHGMADLYAYMHQKSGDT